MKRNYDFSKGAVIKGTIKSRVQVERALRTQKTPTSISLDNNIVALAKKRAHKEGIGYHTWINEKLKNIVLGERGLENRIQKLGR